MRYCGHFLIKAEGGAKNYKRDHPLPLSWRPFTVVFLQRKGYNALVAKGLYVYTYRVFHGTTTKSVALASLARQLLSMRLN